MEKDGIDLDNLEKLFIEERKKHEIASNSKFWALLYLIPTFHNPTGRVLPSEKCQKIVKLARKHNILVFCDDVYNLLYYEGMKPPKRLFAYDYRNDPDYQGNVISNGSFSKIFSPGIRLGWMEMPLWVKAQYWDNHRLFTTSGCPNFFCSGVVACALENGSLAQFVNQLREDFRENVQAAHNLLQRKLPPSCSCEKPKGGYYLWLTLGNNVSCAVLQERAEKREITFNQGSRFCVDQNDQVAVNCLRLSISYYEKDMLCDSIEKLCEIINDLNCRN